MIVLKGVHVRIAFKQIQINTTFA